MTLRTEVEKLRDTYITMAEDSAYSPVSQAIYDQVAINIDNVLLRVPEGEDN